MPSQPSSQFISPEQSELHAMGRKLISACPDMRAMAREAAADILHAHQLDHLEPDTVYWHRFSRSVSSPRTFSGWEHLESPIESMTLPQLVMRRFDANDQDNADNLQVISGFYTAGPEAQRFDESNEVRLLPQDVMDAFWKLNLKSKINDRLADFWRDHPDDFRTLTKANFIAKAREERQSGALTTEAFIALLTAVGIDPYAPPDLDMLRAETTPAQGASVRTLDIAGYEATDILCITEKSGRQFLYIPGDVDPLLVFNTSDELQWWLMNQTNEAANRARFMSHFPMSTHAENRRGVGLNHALDLVFSNWGVQGQSVINQQNRTIPGDPFTHLRDVSKTRMQADAQFALHSNGELRKEMWKGYLHAFGQVFGAMAALDWPIALAVVGAGLADVGLNIDQAIHGRTTAERKSGLIAAIIGSIDVLFNSLFLLHAPTGDLAGAAAEAELTDLPEPVEDAQPASPEATDTNGAREASPVASVELPHIGPIYPEDQYELLAPFETNAILEAYPKPVKEGRMQGIFQGERGATYIEINDMAYRVRYVNELNTWIIVDPENPFSFSRNVPVRLNAAGKWEPLSRQGLKGGGKWLEWLGWRGASALPPRTATPYDLPEELRETLRDIVEHPSGRAFTDYMVPPDIETALAELLKIREKLITDTDAFFEGFEQPQRPPLPDIALNTPPKVAIRQLYENAQGLVIGESHNGVTSKRFLIDNMKQLAKQDVKTLYLEHLFTDLHQADLDSFASTGKMPEKLQRRLEMLDRGHRTDPTGKYTFLNVVKTARKNGIRMRAIDCMSSYRVDGLPDRDGTLRIKAMNFFAHEVIAADQATTGQGRWIAFVGNAHANTFKGVPGVAEIEGTAGVRMVDVAPGEMSGFDLDPGQDMHTFLGRNAGRVQSDYRLRMPVVGRAPSN